ncbi:unnamed protein product [Brugia timori]|uniref:DOP1-like TPR domain-containing protein n=1 Tax=Brugia timori TaxID=42155 RepID=A0A3P7TDF5_9BILA|nr:unnamed protein product [Brugia timori]
MLSSNISGRDKLSINHQIYNSPQHRATLREPYIGMVELRMFLLTVLNALKKHSAEQEQWLTFVVRILPFLDRSLSTFSVHIVEQLCKNLESAVNIAYLPTSDEMHNVSSISRVRTRYLGVSQEKPTYPTNYAIGVGFIICIIFFATGNT